MDVAMSEARAATAESHRTPSAASQHPQQNVSTVELHRRALKLEKAAADLLRSLTKAARNRVLDRAMLSQAEADNLEAAFRYHGGVDRYGKYYWMESYKAGFIPRILKANSEDASLAPVLKAMGETRAAAFHRRYLVADECTWGIPIAVRLFLESRSSRGGTSRMDILRIQAELQDLNKWRNLAIASDRAALLYYGGLLTTYYRCLQDISEVLGVSPAKQANGARQPQAPLLFEEDVPPPCPQTAKIITTRIAQVHHILISYDCVQYRGEEKTYHLDAHTHTYTHSGKTGPPGCHAGARHRPLSCC